jgi:hypothetical protein
VGLRPSSGPREVFINAYIAAAKKHGRADTAVPGKIIGKLLRG